MVNLCHLDNYVAAHTNLDSLYKKIWRLQNKGKELMQTLPGSRDKKREEPPKELAHSDFLLKEMTDMAQDFHEESYYKRYTLAKLAYEAQHVAIQIFRRKAQDKAGLKVFTGPDGAADAQIQDLDQMDARNGLEDHPMVPYPGEPDGLDNPLDALQDAEGNDALFGAPHLNVDDLWGMGVENNEAIKADLDNLSNRSLRGNDADILSEKQQVVEESGQEGAPVATSKSGNAVLDPSGPKVSAEERENQKLRRYQDEVRSIMQDAPMEADQTQL